MSDAIYIYKYKGDWSLSYGKDKQPLMLFKSEEEAMSMALLLKDDKNCNVFMQEKNEEGHDFFKKV